MKKFFAWIKKLFRNLKALADKFVAPSIEVVEGIKKFVDSPAMPIINAIIPGKLDDKVTAALKKYLPEVLKVLRIADECTNSDDPAEVIICAVKHLKNYDPDGRAAAYHSIAALLAHYASDKKISWSEAVHLAEIIFKEKKDAGN